MNMPYNKEALREQVREGRARLSEEKRRDMSRLIVASILPHLRTYDTVMTYAGKSPEVDTDDLMSGLISGGVRVAVPVIQREDHTLRLSWLDDRAVLSESTFGVSEPIGHEIPADPSDIEVTVMPLLGFDRAGNRLGYGAGYYDRFLEKHPDMEKIGLAFSCQELESIQSEEFDISLDLIVTEKEIIRC